MLGIRHEVNVILGFGFEDEAYEGLGAAAGAEAEVGEALSSQEIEMM